MKIQKIPRVALIAATLSFFFDADAVIVGPYTSDSSTLHLWHLDETATPCIDAVGISGTNLTVLGGGATLNNSSFPGFGTALSTLDAGQGGGNVAGNIDASLSPLTLANSAA